MKTEDQKFYQVEGQTKAEIDIYLTREGPLSINGPEYHAKHLAWYSGPLMKRHASLTRRTTPYEVINASEYTVAQFVCHAETGRTHMLRLSTEKQFSNSITNGPEYHAKP